MLEYREDWDMVKQDIMYGIIRAKFTQNPDLCDKLLATGALMLIEGNDWDDRYWGVDKHTGEGKNHLGKILMRVRNELRRQ